MKNLCLKNHINLERNNYSLNPLGKLHIFDKQNQDHKCDTSLHSVGIKFAEEVRGMTKILAS